MNSICKMERAYSELLSEWVLFASCFLQEIELMTVLTTEKGFTDKMERFCQEYLIDLNATQAAIRAGYSENTANVQGSQLLAKLSIRKRIKELAELNAIAAGITPASVLTTIKETMDRCSQERIPVLSKGIQVKVLDETGKEKPVYKTDSQGVYRGAELLGRYLSLFTDKKEITASVDCTPRITADMSSEEAARAYRELFER